MRTVQLLSIGLFILNSLAGCLRTEEQVLYRNEKINIPVGSYDSRPFDLPIKKAGLIYEIIWQSDRPRDLAYDVGLFTNQDWNNKGPDAFKKNKLGTYLDVEDPALTSDLMQWVEPDSSSQGLKQLSQIGFYCRSNDNTMIADMNTSADMGMGMVPNMGEKVCRIQMSLTAQYELKQ